MSRDEVIQLLMTMQAAYPSYKVADKTVTVNLWHEMLKEYESGTGIRQSVPRIGGI